MTPEQYLSEYASNLNLTSSQRALISKRHNSLRESLRTLLPLQDDFLTGSYPRDTIIKANGDDQIDVDFFVAFSHEEYGEYELPKLLKMVRSSLEDVKDDHSEIVGLVDQNRSIGVEFVDGFRIDVVPAVELPGGDMYKIFDKRTMQPIESNPKIHGEKLTQANEETESGSTRRLVPIIKVLKSWRRTKCDYVKSFHLELFAVEMLRGAPIDSYSVGLKDFFVKGTSFVRENKLADPANESIIVDSYLDEDGTRGKLIELLVAESELASLAVELEQSGDEVAANAHWQGLLDDDQGHEKDATGRWSPSLTVITKPPKQHLNVRTCPNCHR